MQHSVCFSDFVWRGCLHWFPIAFDETINFFSVHFSSFEFWFHMILHFVYEKFLNPMTDDSKCSFEFECDIRQQKMHFVWLLWFAHAYFIPLFQWWSNHSIVRFFPFELNTLLRLLFSFSVTVSIMLSIVSIWTGSRNGKRWVVKFLWIMVTLHRWRYVVEFVWLLKCANDHFHFVSVVFSVSSEWTMQSSKFIKQELILRITSSEHNEQWQHFSHGISNLNQPFFPLFFY